MNQEQSIRKPVQKPVSTKEKYLRIKSVLAAHKIALWEYDILSGKCSFDDDYFRVLGLKEAGIAFTDIVEMESHIHPDDRDCFRKSFAEMLSAGGDASTIEVRCVGKDGQTIWLENNFHPCEEDESGHPLQLIAYTANITEEHAQEDKIRKLEDQNRKVIETIPEFIFIFDDNFFLTNVLKAESTVLFHTLDELIGIDARTVYSPEVSDLFLRNIRETLRDGSIREIEYPLDNKGDLHYFQARMSPYDDHKVLAVIHDVTERVLRNQELIEAKQHAEESDRMKSVFLATMSHEIRTPLNAIVGFSELIASGEFEDQRQEYIGIIQQNSELLLQLINDILDLSRIESGKSETRFAPVGITELLGEVEKVHQLKMRPGVELKLVLPPRKISVDTDRGRVTQVLFNFLSNAIKNTVSGSITLGTEMEREWVKLYVEDTGCGMPEDKLPHIFDRFQKLNDFLQGTGLGLAICKSIAERLGGRIEVTSRLGKGSRFSLCLPYREEHPATEAVPANSRFGMLSTGKAVQGNRPRILVAEDTEANYKLLEALLGGEYELILAVNGEEAVHEFVREHPDLVLMDIDMPVMNGIEATEKIRTISPDIPVIAVTSHAYFTETQQATAAGCSAIVSKPYSLEDLRRTVAYWLGKK